MTDSARTLTRADLINAVYDQIGLSFNECNALVDAVFDEMARTLEKGEVLKISSFGSFSVRKKKERIGRNPKTGKEAKISPRSVLAFSPSNLLKTEVNENLAGKK